MFDEITNYGDVYNSVSFDKKTSMYIYKDKFTNRKYMMCFEPSQEMARFKSTKQKMADIVTTHVIQGLTNRTYQEFFKTFYVSTNTVIESYAKMRGLRVPEDLCFFYKGGNLYKILLSELLPLFSTSDFSNLLKRSDADFGLFVNPDAPHYEQVFAEVSVLITYMLYCFKRHMCNSNLGTVFKSAINESLLMRLLKDELTSSNVTSQTTTLLLDKPHRDFVLIPINIHGEYFVMYKENSMILEGVPKVQQCPFYLSRNTAIRFKRKDDTYNSFDLMRMKFNVKVKVDQSVLNIPSEVIDVGIAKKEDSGLKTLRKGANKCLKQYHFREGENDKGFFFWGPTLSYMIKDIDVILFYQNDYPWHDKKTTKRVQRYFLCLVLQTIVSTAIEDPIMKINIIKQEFKKLIKFLRCFNENTPCEAYGEENVSGLFYAKYKKLSKKLNSISDLHKRAKELKEFRDFNRDIIKVLESIVKNLIHLISNTSDLKLKHLQKKIAILNTTWHLGGEKVVGV